MRHGVLTAIQKENKMLDQLTKLQQKIFEAQKTLDEIVKDIETLKNDNMTCLNPTHSCACETAMSNNCGCDTGGYKIKFRYMDYDEVEGNNNYKKIIIEYVRDKNRRRIGVLAAVVDNQFGVNYGYSLCHKNDKFDASIGKRLAIGRANNTIEWGKGESFPSLIDHALDDFHEKTERRVEKWRKNAQKA